MARKKKFPVAYPNPKKQLRKVRRHDLIRKKGVKRTRKK